ncbi:MAG: hypothetical protein ACE5I7_20780 [Candidatus Binatia bacterium]
MNGGPTRISALGPVVGAALIAPRATDAPLVQVVADHGGVGHGHTFYDGVVVVPLIQAEGGLRSTERLTNLVRLIDDQHMLLDLLGIPCVPRLGTHGFGNHAAGATQLAAWGRIAFCEWLLFAEHKVALRTDLYKYMWSVNGMEELYDLGSDAAELRDIAATADLTWARELTMCRHHTREPNSPLELSDELRAQCAATRTPLRDLGYI